MLHTCLKISENDEIQYFFSKMADNDFDDDKVICRTAKLAVKKAKRSKALLRAELKLLYFSLHGLSII